MFGVGGKKHGDILIDYSGFIEKYYIVEEVSVERSHLRCEGCYFKPGYCCFIPNSGTSCNIDRSRFGRCNASREPYQGHLIFKRISLEYMNDELRIKVPKGFVIDTENSNLNDGIIKFKSVFPSFSEIIDFLNKESLTIVSSAHSPSIKVTNIAKLKDIATYFNYRREYGLEKYYIVKKDSDYSVIDDFRTGTPGFRNKEDALLVIEHFKDILDEIFK